MQATESKAQQVIAEEVAVFLETSQDVDEESVAALEATIRCRLATLGSPPKTGARAKQAAQGSDEWARITAAMAAMDMEEGKWWSSGDD